MALFPFLGLFSGKATTAGSGDTLTCAGSGQFGNTVTITTNPGTLPAVDAGTLLHLAGADGSTPRIEISSFGAGSQLLMRTALGTLAAKSGVVTSSDLGSVVSEGWDTTAYGVGSYISFAATETWSATAHGSAISFRTTVNGTVALVERLRIDHNGLLLVNNYTNTFSAPARSLGTGVGANTLGTTAASYMYMVEFQGANGNTARLQFAQYRRQAGSTWNGAGWRMQYAVDNSFADGSLAYIEVGADLTAVGKVVLGTSGGDRLVIDGAGRVGINAPSPSYQLDVGGDVNTSTAFKVAGAPLTPFDGFKNKLINATFAFNQRGYASGGALPSTAYAHDRWRNGAGSTGSYTFTQASLGESGATHSIDTVVTIPSGMNFDQPVEVGSIEGGTYVLSWSGTAQGTVYYYDGTGYQNPIVAGVSGRSGVIPPGCSVIVRFMNGTLSTPQLELGSVATPFERRPPQIELALCQRYFQKSYALAVSPGSAPGAGGCTYNSNAPGTNCVDTLPFPVRMRVAPTITMYDGAGTSGKVSYYTSSWNNGGATTSVIGREGCLFVQTNIASSQQINYEWAASAEL